MGAKTVKQLTAENKALKSSLEGQSELTKSLTDAMVEMQKEIKAINNPVIITKTHNVMEQQIGQDGPPLEFVGDESRIEMPRPMATDGPEFKTKMDRAAFMNEIVDVHIHDTSEKNADGKIGVAVNGEACSMFRGQNYSIKRYFVEALVRAKPISYGNVEYTTNTGERAVKYPQSTGLRYPFDVVRDHNPCGRAWLNALLAEAA